MNGRHLALLLGYLDRRFEYVEQTITGGEGQRLTDAPPWQGQERRTTSDEDVKAARAKLEQACRPRKRRRRS